MEPPGVCGQRAPRAPGTPHFTLSAPSSFAPGVNPTREKKQRGQCPPRAIPDGDEITTAYSMAGCKRCEHGTRRPPVARLPDG